MMHRNMRPNLDRAAPDSPPKRIAGRKIPAGIERPRQHRAFECKPIFACGVRAA